MHNSDVQHTEAVIMNINDGVYRGPHFVANSKQGDTRRSGLETGEIMIIDN